MVWKYLGCSCGILRALLAFTSILHAVLSMALQSRMDVALNYLARQPAVTLAVLAAIVVSYLTCLSCVVLIEKDYGISRLVCTLQPIFPPPQFIPRPEIMVHLAVARSSYGCFG